MLILALIGLLFSSCSDDDDEVTTVQYSMGFNSMSTSDVSEMYVIESAYKEALGVSSSSFTLSGTVSECDNKVKSACKNAEKTLQEQTIQGSYLFVVTNYNSMQDVYTHQFN